jgi:hypothetical protein
MVTKECFKYTYPKSIKTYLKPGEITKTNMPKYIRAIPMDTGDNVDMSVLDGAGFLPASVYVISTKYALYAMSKMHNTIFVPHPITDTYIMQMPSHVEDRMVRSIRGFDRTVHHKMRPEIIAATCEKPPIPADYDQWLDLVHRKKYDHVDVVDIINNHATSDVCAYIVKHFVSDLWTLPLDADLGPCTITDLIAKIEPEDARTYDLTWLLKSTYGIVDNSLDYRVFYRADMDWYWFKRLMDAHGNTKEVIEYAVVPYISRDHIFN